jgi:hypothetical protein
MTWFFNLIDDVVHLQARLEDGDTLGDASGEVHAGEDFYGVSYDAMKQAESGEIEVGEDGKGRIVS